ncbi:MAG: hypothetical protein GY710_10130 [Desulfobacteraceae bacterium]|nr:hypothetical protein [Desulfobacteraceae bacterium]
MDFLKSSHKILKDIAKKNIVKKYNYTIYKKDCRAIYQWLSNKKDNFTDNPTLSLIKKLAFKNALHLLVMERSHIFAQKSGKRLLEWNSYESTGGGYIESTMFSLKLVTVLIHLAKDEKIKNDLIGKQLHKIIHILRQSSSFYCMEESIKKKNNYFFVGKNSVVVDGSKYDSVSYNKISKSYNYSRQIKKAVELNLEAIKASPFFNVRQYDKDAFFLDSMLSKIMSEKFLAWLSKKQIDGIWYITGKKEAIKMPSYLIFVCTPSGSSGFRQMLRINFKNGEDKKNPYNNSDECGQFIVLEYVCRSLYGAYLKTEHPMSIYKSIACLDTMHFFGDGNGRTNDFLLNLFLSGAMKIDFSSIFNPWFYSYNVGDCRVRDALCDEGIDYMKKVSSNPQEQRYFGIHRFEKKYKKYKKLQNKVHEIFSLV